MAQIAFKRGYKMRVELLAHTQLADEFYDRFDRYPLGNYDGNDLDDLNTTDGQLVALTAIRTCYSSKEPSKIIPTEGMKYFGEKGKEANRLFNHIVKSGHTSTLEHISFTFTVEGVSRALLAQLTRHRHMSFSVQSQRYVKLSSESRSGGFGYVVPETVKQKEGLVSVSPCVAVEMNYEATVNEYFDDCMLQVQHMYDKLIELGIPQEDARAVLPNAATCNLVLTANLRTLLDFYSKRKPGAGAQHEITQLAEELKNRVIEVESWTESFF